MKTRSSDTRTPDDQPKPEKKQKLNDDSLEKLPAVMQVEEPLSTEILNIVEEKCGSSVDMTSNASPPFEASKSVVDAPIVEDCIVACDSDRTSTDETATSAAEPMSLLEDSHAPVALSPVVMSSTVSPEIVSVPESSLSPCEASAVASTTPTKVTSSPSSTTSSPDMVILADDATTQIATTGVVKAACDHNKSILESSTCADETTAHSPVRKGILEATPSDVTPHVPGSTPDVVFVERSPPARKERKGENCAADKHNCRTSHALERFMKKPPILIETFPDNFTTLGSGSFKFRCRVASVGDTCLMKGGTVHWFILVLQSGETTRLVVFNRDRKFDKVVKELSHIDHCFMMCRCNVKEKGDIMKGLTSTPFDIHFGNISSALHLSPPESKCIPAYVVPSKLIIDGICDDGIFNTVVHVVKVCEMDVIDGRNGTTFLKRKVIVSDPADLVEDPELESEGQYDVVFWKDAVERVDELAVGRNYRLLKVSRGSGPYPYPINFGYLSDLKAT